MNHQRQIYLKLQWIEDFEKIEYFKFLLYVKPKRMSHYLEVHFIENGKKLDINSLSEFDLDSLRDCIYDFIPETSKLCMYSSDDIKTCGEISNFTNEEFNLYKNFISKIEPNNPKWKNGIVVVLKKSLSNTAEKWREILKTNLVIRKKRKYCCSKCKKQGHNKLNKKHK